MFLKFPAPGKALDATRSPLASTGRFLASMRTFLLLPLLLLSLGVACSHHKSHASDPGTAPTITTAPSDATTVTGRPVSFTVVAAGAPVLRYQWAKDGVNILGALGATYTLQSPRVADSGHYTVTITNPNGTLTTAPVALAVVAAVTFNAPMGVIQDAAGNTYVSDMADHTIWKVSPTNQKTLLAGMSGIPGTLDGKGIAAQFDTPGGLALDASGNLLVADTGNHTIRRIAPDGTVVTVAGAAGIPGTTDGLGTAARFNAPTCLAITATGSVYISDAQNHTIRLMAADGTVSTYAGTAGKPGQVDGDRSTALFNEPNGLALSANGTLYVADYGNSVIRAISPSGTVSLLAGQYGTHGYVDGTYTTALFYLPVGLTINASGTLYVTDTGNHAVRKITPLGVVNVVAGSGSAGNADGLGDAALFNLPCGVTVTSAGLLVVADTDNHILRSIDASSNVSTFTTP